jgi:hypothetical protein
MGKIIDSSKIDLIKCTIQWDRGYETLIVITEDNRVYMPATGEFGGFFDEIKIATPLKQTRGKK